MNWLDVSCKIATVIIALFNIIFAIYIFNKNRKRELTCSLILNYSIKYFYKYFEDLDSKLDVLKTPSASNDLKKEIEKEIQSLGRKFEQQFIDLFLSVNPEMHRRIANMIDDMTGQIVEAMFDEGINLYIEQKYDDMIASPIILTKAKLLKILLESN